MEQPAQAPTQNVTQNVTEHSVLSDSHRNNKKKPVIIIAILIFTLVIVGVVLFYFKSTRRNQSEDVQKTPVFTGEVVIGYNADQSTGPTAPFGVWGAQGFQIAIDEINAKGGILGKKIRPVILDDKADKDLSVKNMKQLIFEEKALAVVGPGNSANALAWIDLAQDNETIVITHIATATEITQKFKDRQRNYIFRIGNLDKDQVRILMAWGIRETKNGKFAIIHDTTGYGMQGVKDVTEVLARWGKTPVAVKSFERGASIADLIKIIENVKSAKADGIVLYALADSNADILKALDQVEGYSPVVLGAASNSVGLGKLAGPLAEKITFTSSIGSDFNERAKNLNDKIVKRYGTAPELLSSGASGYDAVYFLAEAIKKAGSLEPGAIRDALENLENIQGTQKLFVKPFSKDNHEALQVTDVFLSRWIDGKLTKFEFDIEELEIR